LEGIFLIFDRTKKERKTPAIKNRRNADNNGGISVDKIFAEINVALQTATTKSIITDGFIDIMIFYFAKV
jgi:hypothetical protein